MNIQEAIHTLESHGISIHKGVKHYMVTIHDYVLDAELELELTESEVISLCEGHISFYNLKKRQTSYGNKR